MTPIFKEKATHYSFLNNSSVFKCSPCLHYNCIFYGVNDIVNDSLFFGGKMDEGGEGVKAWQNFAENSMKSRIGWEEYYKRLRNSMIRSCGCIIRKHGGGGGHLSTQLSSREINYQSTP